MKAIRNSSIEVLRLLCILGITVMHSFAGIDTSASILNTEVHVLYNSLFNVGVTCFVLISGYYGIRFNAKKLIRMDMMVIFFTLFGTILIGDIGIKSIIKSFIPIISRQYWFISCYFVLCILSPFLNMVSEHLELKKFKKLLLVLLLIFSIIPTFTTYDIMRDAGKGLVHFVMIYLIGRYIALYLKENYSRKRLFCGFILSIFIIFLVDSVRTLANGEIYTTLARDCSVFIIFAAVLLFMLFKEYNFENKIINRLTANVLAITVLDAYFQKILSSYIDLNAYNNNKALFLIILIYSVIIGVTAMLLNEIRKLIFGRVENFISEYIYKFLVYIKELALKLGRTMVHFFINP